MKKNISLEDQTIAIDRSKISPQKHAIRHVHKAASLDQRSFSKILKKLPSKIDPPEIKKDTSKLSTNPSNPSHSHKHSSLQSFPIQNSEPA